MEERVKVKIVIEGTVIKDAIPNIVNLIIQGSTMGQFEAVGLTGNDADLKITELYSDNMTVK